MEDNTPEIRILLIEDDAGDVVLVHEMLAESETPVFVVDHVARLALARQRLLAASFDVILLDLSLPDGEGLSLVTAVREAAPSTPIVVMSGRRDDDFALTVVQAGVQDYCVKGHVDSFLLRRVLRYAIERKRIEDDLRRSNAELAVLFHVSSAVSRSIDLHGVLADIIDSIAGLEGLHLEKKGAILTVEDDGSLRLAHEVGHTAEFISAHQQLPMGACLCGRAAAEGKMLISDGTCQDERHKGMCASMPAHGHIIVPLKARERVLGVLCLYTASHITVVDAEQKMLLSIGEQIGVAIENAKLYEATKRLALHDPLTGLANRRHLDIVAKRSLAMARRYGTPFSIILLDLDHFKLYNDTHGHSAGDELLVVCARTMKKEVRDTNLVVRYGGEEFLILLPDTEITAALAVAERLRVKINENTGVTVSLGVSSAKDASRTMSELIVMADTALYQAKNSGRNKVVCAAPQRKTVGEE